MSSIVTTLRSMCQEVLTAVAGGVIKRHLYIVGYLDGFGVNQSVLTDEHRRVMDGLFAVERTGSFPFVPGNANHRIVLIAGMASQTGPEANNIKLGGQRARNVYDYLATRIDSSQLDDNVQSVGSSRPRIDEMGSELPVNRAVGIVFEIAIPIVVASPLPPPREDPPPPKSRQWEIVVTKVTSASPLSILPTFKFLGPLLHKIEGLLRNVRTGVERKFTITALGASVGYSVLPINSSINIQSDQFIPFATHWADFDDFDHTSVLLLGASATVTLLEDQVSDSVISLPELYAIIEINGRFLQINTGIGAEALFGLLTLE